MKATEHMRIPPEVKNRLESQKIHDSEPLWRVIDRQIPQETS